VIVEAKREVTVKSVTLTAVEAKALFSVIHHTPVATLCLSSKISQEEVLRACALAQQYVFDVS
jgi:hypothetical protein